jgi:glutamate racemase
MTAFDPVGMMDSGIGGLPYLESARLLLPDQSFVYLADREGFPYGTKSRVEVESIVLDRVRRLVAHWHPRALVIACNTASQAALAAVRADNPGIPVIGTVPAIKPAAERSKTRIVGILATAGAIGDPYLDELVANFARGSRVARRAAQDLVDFVERRFLRSTAAERREAVLPHVRYLVDEGVDEIVLACTHFLHVAADIAAVAAELCMERGRGPVEVIDSREGVARRLRQVLETEGGLGDGTGPGGGIFLVTGEEPIDSCYADFAGRYGLEGPLRLDPAP